MFEDGLPKAPNIEALKPDEEVEWSVYKDVDNSKYLLLMSLAFTVFVIGVVSLTTLPSLEFLPLQLFASLFFVLTIYLYLRHSRNENWYCITTKRILETEGKRIVAEIDRSRLGEIPLHELISMRIIIYESEYGNTKHYDITIHDPKTFEPLIMFNRIWFTEVENKTLFHDMQECSSCQARISSKLEKCLACGQSLM